jgi:hypothetical protein
VISERYLKDKEYVKLTQIYDSMLKTPGERRVQNAAIIEEGIKEGVKQGFFGVGELKEDGKVVCRYFKEDPTVSGIDTEVLMSEASCLSQRRPTVVEAPGPENGLNNTIDVVEKTKPLEPIGTTRHDLSIRFLIPRGKISQIMGVMNFLQSKFQSLEMEIKARDGSLTEDEYTSKIKEALKQLGIDLDRE